MECVLGGLVGVKYVEMEGLGLATWVGWVSAEDVAVGSVPFIVVTGDSALGKDWNSRLVVWL